MWNKDVKQLYKKISVGTPVLIINGPYGSFGQGLRILAPGNRGADVQAVQKRLKELGFYKYREDGVFGPSLQYALNKFQQSKKIPKKNKIGKVEYEAMGIFEFE